MYVCLYVYMYVCMYVCMYVYPQKSVTLLTCPGGRTTKSTRTCGGIGQKECICVCVCVCECVGRVAQSV